MYSKLRPFEPYRWKTEHVGHPCVHFDDVSAIPFVRNVAGVEEYQHRARTRAGDLDTFVTVTPAVPGYESYCRETLRLGSPVHLIAEPAVSPSAVAKACLKKRTRAALVETARNSGAMTLHPYMGIEEVWELASVISTDSQTPVCVIGPPPPVNWVANDKALFDELVSRVLGRDWLVDTRIARDAEGIRTDLRAMAQRHPRVGLKRTRCASAMGNAVFDSDELLEDPRRLEQAVNDFLQNTEWPRGEEVLCVAWLNASASPSTQLWIPPLGHGSPRLDGIYEQVLRGQEGVFVGSRPSTLPDAVNRSLGNSALQVAAALQELGFAGRCSFDHLVTGEPAGSFEVVFSECNGRWGGTSTPMSLLDRIKPGPRPSYRAQDVLFPKLAGAKLHDLLRLLDELLFRTDSGQGRFILYNVGPLAGHGKFDVISIGADPEDAERGVLEILPKRLGL